MVYYRHGAMADCIITSGFSAMPCNESCFGQKEGNGTGGFDCTGSEQTLLSCSRSNNDSSSPCTDHAGVVCCELFNQAI